MVIKKRFTLKLESLSISYKLELFIYIDKFVVKDEM